MTVKENTLNEKQEMAVELTCMGKTDKEIAKQVGVTRQWVNKWRNHDTNFMHAVAIRREAQRKRHQDGMSDLVEKAITVVRKALDEGDEKTQLKTALNILKMSGLQVYEKQESQLETEKVLIEKTLVQVVKEMGFEG